MSTPNYDQSKLASIKTYMLIAYIFTIIAIIVFIIAGIWEIYSYTAAQSVINYYNSLGTYYGTYYAQLYAASLTSMIVSGIVLIVFGGFAAYIFFTRIRKMYTASNTNDVNTMKSLNNMMWAILALIFAGVLPGIMLLIAFGPINELGKASPPPPPPPPPPPT